MAGIFAYTCSCCGQRHEGSPSFDFDAPMPYSQLSEQERKDKASFTSDLCIIRHEDQTDRFVRAILEVPIHGVDEPFLWGIWVTLSETAFERYTSTSDEPDESDSYFGWFSNMLPYYPNTVNLKTNVRPRTGGMRPYIELQETDHPLFFHARDGISIEEAQRIAEQALHGS